MTPPVDDTVSDPVSDTVPDEQGGGVVVDDFLPVDKRGELLCSHTKNNDGCLELWVPILEKVRAHIIISHVCIGNVY